MHENALSGCATDPILWFCCESCKERANATSLPSQDVDHELEYSKDVMWHGLIALCRQDEIRENDGPRMVLHWKVDML